MKQTFQGIPVNFPPVTATTVVGGGISSPATYWFWLQGRNRQGFNLLSASTSCTVAPGDRIELIIPATCRPADDGSDIREILVLASTSNNPTLAVNIASRSGLDLLPGVVTLDADEHLVMGMAQLVDSEADLPSSPIRGMRRQVEGWSEIREWSGSAWVRCEPQEFSTYIEQMDGPEGALQSLSLVPAELIQPVGYGVDSNDSEVVTYWLINDTSVPVEASTGIACTVESGGRDISGLINNGSLLMAFWGYANANTAMRDAQNADGTGQMVAIGEWLEYPGVFTGLVLPKDLLPGMAYAISFKLNMGEAMARFAAYDGQLIGFRLDLEPYTAHLVPMGLFTGSLIAADGGRRRIMPGGTGLSLMGLTGTGVIKISEAQAYLFRLRPVQEVAGLSAETAGQQIYISAQGNLFVASVPGATSALRAIIGTVSGFGAPVSAGSVILGTSYHLLVTVPIPSAIRADYPDVIANTAGIFNASSIRIYAKPVTGDVLYWDAPIPLDEENVVISIGVAGTSLGTNLLPTVDSTFGLYSPIGAIAGRVEGISSHNFANYEIFVGFYYSGAITSISHSTALGCIPEADGSIGDIFNLLQYISPPVFQFGHIRAIPPEQRRPLRQVFCAIAQGNYRWNPVETRTEDLDFSFQAAAGDPASGELALDNADPSLAGEIKFHAWDRDGVLIDDLIGGIAVDSEIQLDAEGSGNVYARFKSLGIPVLAADIYTLQVVYLAGGGGSFTDGLIVLSVGAGFIRPYNVARGSPGRWVPEVAVAAGGEGGGGSLDFDRILTLDDQVLVLDGNVVYLDNP